MRLFILLLNIYTVYAEVCLGTQRTQDTFVRMMYAKYGGDTCASSSDCETKCTAGCDGYSQIPSGTVVLQVSAGSDFSCSLSSDGVVNCWGSNTYGQLGDGSTTTRSTPVTPTLESAAVAIECGHHHTCALLDTGKVQCWGRNQEGQLGIDSTTTKNTPQTVLNIEGATQLSAATEGYHTCVLFGTGEVKCWGSNNYGQLGIGSTASTGNSAGEMAGLQFTDVDGAVRYVKCGGSTTCAIMMNNDLKCWGYNGLGQLGIDSTISQGDGANEMGSNLQVTMSNVLKVSVGDSITCAITTGFTVHCWGREGYTGYDDSTRRTTPGPAISLGKDAVDIQSGYRYTCAIFKDGSGKCWGNNDHGKLGQGVSNGHQGDASGEMAALSFIDLSGTGSEAWMIATGNRHTCGVIDGKVACWGLSHIGQAGGSTCSYECYEPDGNIDYGYGAVTYTYAYGSKVGKAGLSKELSDICAPCVANEYVQQRYELGPYAVESGQTSYTCNTLAACEPQCSGDANCVGYTEDQGLKAVAFGQGRASHEMVLFDDGSVRCIAVNGHSDKCGTDDDSAFYDINTPSTWGLTKLSGPAIAVATVEYGGCALMQDGSLECWMDYQMQWFVFINPGTSGKVGNDATNPMEQHRALDTGSYRFKNISSSDSGMCGILKGTDEGKVACWGYFGYTGGPGAGYSSPTNTIKPLPIMDFGSPAKDLSCGDDHCCFLLDDNSIKCFGANLYGQLGIGSTTVVEFPNMVASVDIGTHVPAKIYCGHSTTFVITTTGELIGWGNNAYHELGYNDADHAFGNKQGDEPGEMGANLIVTMTNVRSMGGRRGSRNALVTNDDIMYTTDNTATPWAQRETNVNFVGYISFDYHGNWIYVKKDGVFGAKDYNENPAYAPVNMKNMGLACITCAGGTYNRPGDTTAGTCDDDETCNANFYSDATQCVACPFGTTSVGAAVVDGNSYCKRNAPCGVDEYVTEDSVCAICPFGGFSDAIATEYTATPCLKPAATCGENEHSSIQFVDTDTRYFGNTCANCETDCMNDANCLGYTPGNKIISITGYYHLGCTASSEGVKCWGTNKDGVLGIGSSDASLIVTADEATNIPLQGVVKLRTARFYSSNIHAVWAIFEDGSVRSWGHNFYGRLGYDDTTNRNEPGPPIETHGGEVLDMCGTYSYTCMLLKDGRVFCWGQTNNEDSATASTSTTRNTASLPAMDFGGTATKIACGKHNACVVTDDKVKCWSGYLGSYVGADSGAAQKISPTLPYVLGLTKTVVDIAATEKAFCVVYNDGNIKCWGNRDALPYSASGNIGDAAGEMEAAPEGDITDVIKIEGGFNHFCAVQTGGGMKCWGKNAANGATGYKTATVGTAYRTYLPSVDLSPELGTVVDVMTGSYWSCAILDTGNAKCFGDNKGGERGDSDTLDRDVTEATNLYASVYDNSYGSMTSSGKGYAKRSLCGACPVNTTRPAGDSLSGATWCISETTCEKDEFMNTNYECQACAEGVFNNPGDNSPGICNDQAVCTENQHVSGGMCLSCPANTTNPAGDDTNNGNSYCTLDIPCAQNEFVNNQHQCTSCPPEAYNDVGDTTVGTCDDTEKCTDGYHVKTTFTSDNTKKYGSTPCDNATDCETKCIANATCAGYTAGGAEITLTTSTTTGNLDIFDMSVDGTIRLAAGRDWSKKLYVSTDSGVTWNDKAPADDYWKGVSMSADGSKIFACFQGANGAYLSTDSGETWTNLAADYTNGPLYEKCKISSDGTKLVNAYRSTSLGKIWTSSDDGATWSVSYSGFKNWNDIVISSDGTKIVATETENIWYSHDGAAWQIGYTSTSSTSYLTMSNDGMKVFGAVGGNKPIRYSHDGGVTWGESGGDLTSTNYKGIDTSADGTVAVATAYNENIYISTDSGVTWSIDPSANYGANWRGIAISPDGTKILTGGYSLNIYNGEISYSREYGLQVGGVGTSFTKAKGCQLCPAGYNNEPMDDPLLDDTTCDFIPCVEDQKVVGGSCTACVLGSTKAAGDADPLVDTYCFCGINQHVVDKVCTECPTGGTRPAGDDESGANTECLIAPCAKDYHVVSGACVPCPTGFTNDAGDTNELGDTFCDANFVCIENQYVLSNQCEDCTEGTAAYGADPGGPDTVCVCGKNEYSDGAACQACGYGTFNDAGSPVDQVGTCDGIDVCETDEHVSLKFVLNTGQQISNGAGYSSAQTDLEKAKRMCVADQACKGLTKDGTDYYLSDGTMSANAAYDAYLIYRDEYMCAPCGGTGSRVAGDVADTETSCSFTTCAAEEGVEDFVCTACTGGNIQPTPLNPVVGNQACYTPPCLENEYASGACVACPTDATNVAGDLPDDGDTICDFGTCGKDEHVSSHACVSCATGFNDPGDWRGADSTCDDIELCDANEYAGSSYDYNSDTNKYEGSSCSDSSDCETKCTADAACAGYTNNGGGVEAWGDNYYGGSSPGITSNVKDIVTNFYAFAALKNDGSVAVWGVSGMGGDDPGITSGVSKIFSTKSAFAALMDDGSVQTWGESGYGGNDPGIGAGSGIVDIFSNEGAFAALKTNGGVLTWGSNSFGGGTGAPAGHATAAHMIAVKIVPTRYSGGGCFAAVLKNGEVQLWGSNSCRYPSPPTSAQSGVVDVTTLANNAVYAYAALKDDGSVVVWGSSTTDPSVADPGITSGVTKIFSNDYAFAALKSDGSVQVWGDSTNGGSDPSITSGVVEIFSTPKAFAALKSDGSVVAWGDSGYGGTDPGITSGVTKIFSSERAFAALKSDGSVVAWGSSSYGGTDPSITSGVVDISSSKQAFAAIMSDGSVQTWGHSSRGGQDPGIGAGSGTFKIVSTADAFAALLNPSIDYGPLVAGTGDSKVKQSSGIACTSCPGVGTNPAARVNESTACTFPDCQTDQYSVGDGVCLACQTGRSMPTPVNPTEASKCLCATGEHAVNGSCVTCPAGFTNVAGDSTCDICYETGCDFIPCAKDHYVVGTGYDRVCTQCAGGTYSGGGNVTECGTVQYCEVTERSSSSFASDTNKYGGTACSDATDCQTKCSVDAECSGYTIIPPYSSWSEDSSIGTAKAWQSVASSADGTKLAAVPYNGNIYTSTDSGVSWTPVASAEQWYGIASSSNGTKLAAIVKNGNIYTSTDSGATWTPVATAQTWYGIASSADGTKLVAVANGENIWTSSDSGATWTEHVVGSSEAWTRVASSADGSKLAATVYNGNLWVSTDSGATWTEDTSVGSTEAWYSIASSSDGTKMVAAAYGDYIYISSDSGSTWVKGSLHGNWYGIAMSADGSTIVASKEGGNTWVTTDGTTWTEDTSVGATKSWNSLAISADGSKLLGSVSSENLWTGEIVIYKEYGPTVAGTVDSEGKTSSCIACATGYENDDGITAKGGPDGTCIARTCSDNEYSDGSICVACPQYTGAVSAGLNPTLGETQCVAAICQTDEHVVNNVCTACDSDSYRLAGDQIYGGDTHCFCKDNQKVIDKACVACEVGSSNPNLCYSGLQNHYCVCHENYHVVSNLCTACPAGATRTAGDYAGNADTYCTCGENQRVVNNECVACPVGTNKPAGDDSSGADTGCSCLENEHIRNVSGTLQCTSCPTGSIRTAGDLVADGATSCACPENYHVAVGECLACVGGTRAAGDDPSTDTHCSCLEDHRILNNVCTTCPTGEERLAGDDASGNNTACACKQNYSSTGSGCAECTTGAIIGAGSDPLVATVCTCSEGYEPNGAVCDACAATEQSGLNTSCVCKENHHYDGSACVACPVGSIRAGGDPKENVTVCEAVICAENQRVLNNECVNCLPGKIKTAGDEASGIDTVCTFQGTSHVVSTAGLYAFRIDTLPNNGEMTIRAGETHTFYRASSGDPFRIVSEADCEGKECNKAQYTTLPSSSLGISDAEDEVAVTVFTPDTAGVYYYLSTETPYRKGRIVVEWSLCTISYPITNLSTSCELSAEESLTGDLSIQYVTQALRAQVGDVPQIKAAEGARHFTVSGGFKLSLNDVDLNGGRGTEGGSILIDNGEIDANNVKFTDNVASLQGGAIRVKNAASKVTLSNILFEDNQGTEGGAIATDALTEPVEIHASDFKANRAASGDGGAIKTDTVVNITGTNFEANLANSGEGGGISASKDITISGSSFKSNRALQGGALKSEDNTVTMSNMVVEANEAVEDGGAFLAKNSEFDIRTSTILANKAKRGAAFKTSFTGCTTNCKKLRIRSSSLEDNEATLEGGAVDFDADADAEPQFWIQDTKMKNNKARGEANDFKKRGSKVKIKAIDSDIGTIEGGDVDKVCEAGQCSGRGESTCEVTATGTECACSGTTKHLSGEECKVHTVCTGLGLDVEIRAPDKKHDRLCGTQDIADLAYKLDDKGKELAELIETKLVAEGVAADQAYALAVEVFGEINKCN